MKKLVIIGGGGFGREVYDWASVSPACGRDWSIKGFLDDAPSSALKGIIRSPNLGRIKDYRPDADDVFLCAIGAPFIRRQMQVYFSGLGCTFVTLVHPSATLSKTAVLGVGVIVGPYGLISSDAVVNDGAVVYYHTSIDHDARVGRWTQISGHCDIMGAAQIGEGVFVGSHAAILPGVQVGDRAIVGAGAIVNRDVAPDNTVAGIPARILGSQPSKFAT